MTDKLPLAITIISYNESANIGRTLESVVRFAAEIIIVDSFSTDDTCEIAARYGAHIYQEAWKGMVAQKNSAMSRCTQPWILSLDCDEVVSSKLGDDIAAAVTSGPHDAYLIKRRSHYLGKRLKYSWYPDKKLRLVRRSAQPHFEGYDPHDRLVANGSIGELEGDLIHYSYKNLEDHFLRIVKYAHTAARSYHVAGKKFHWYQAILRACFAFTKRYFIQRGFLDGLHGYIVAVSSFTYVLLKYFFLWEMSDDA
ncbi:MAG: glycosyltransferase family 2 protein [Desulfosarcinaceae bacterium]